MKFTHVENQSPTMVDVSEKPISSRTALAEAVIYLGESVMEAFVTNGWSSKKGPILDTAIIAGTMGAKKTPDLIPFCHSIPLRSVKINIEPMDASHLRIIAEVKATDQTGVEMEALTAVSVASLTLYDMCKAVSKDIQILNTRLLRKTGGKQDYQNQK